MTSIVGDIEGKTILMIDDMITTGGTVAEASKILKEHGAGKIYVAATHGVFAGEAIESWRSRRSNGSSSRTRFRRASRLAPIKDRLTVLSVAPLMGEAIKRIHLNQSVSAVLKGGGGGKR